MARYDFAAAPSFRERRFGGEFGLGFIGPNVLTDASGSVRALFDANSLAVPLPWQKNKRIARRWICSQMNAVRGAETNPLSRDEQLRINKRNQLRRAIKCVDCDA